jgi:hypothetical protein
MYPRSKRDHKKETEKVMSRKRKKEQEGLELLEKKKGN